MASGAKRKLAEYRRKRDFSRTPEPAGSRSGSRRHPAPAALHFIIQKHAASHLHFDLRLELDGVMKSWAVPKGPSVDPSVKRLAMEVEDHPMEYNTFEGTIPRGQYGGGTVMLWDRGTYEADEADGDDAKTLRREYDAGKMSFTLHGERLRGSFTLVRTRGPSAKPQWLLMKHRDRYARPGSDIVAESMTSVDSGRTMEEIANGASRIWQSDRATGNRPAGRRGSRAAPREAPVDDAAISPRRPGPSKRAVSSAALEPMYATVGQEIPPKGGWTFEPKYDGIRVLAFITARSVKLITRNGKEKTKQFPEIVESLRAFQQRADRSLVLDGEIVAFKNGSPGRFQELQARMHVKDATAIGGHAEATPARFVAFDLLLDGEDVLIHRPWSERRKQLERLWGRRRDSTLVLTDSIRDDGEAMVERARAEGWEGVIAKRIDAAYEPGIRSRSWLKLKIEHRQEFVVGGYTEPRNTREHIGALLLGYFDNDRFIYVGHTGGGFTRDGLREMHRRLAPLERRTSPFEETPPTNERAHWVTPKVVVEVKFNEWTMDGKLRQPIYLGTRDDKAARDVGREPESLADRSRSTDGRRPRAGAVRRRTDDDARPGARAGAKKKGRSKASPAPRKRAARKGNLPTSRPVGSLRAAAIARQLARMQDDGVDGAIDLAPGATLHVSSLDKVFFPGEGYTKGDLMRYYVDVSPAILPAIQDRPLVLKRFPNGIGGTSFYQQKAPDEAPDVVRVETIRNEEGAPQRRLIGGDLATLLYTIQLGAISVDPWHGRVGALEFADYTILDLDPGPRATFSRVVEVAIRVKEVMESLGLHGIVKTSGASGLHIVIPLPPRTPEEAALLVAQLVATRVADAHPRDATIERSVKARPPATVYVDYLQNIRAKTVAGVYSVRARPAASVSTPLEWSELIPSLDPREFTITTVPRRLVEVGDLWGPAMRVRNSLSAVLEALPRGRSAGGRDGRRRR
jgi:bifunctional non-homologous end joining protein LigD